MVEFEDFIMAVPPTLEEWEGNKPFYNRELENGNIPPSHFRFFFPRGWGDEREDSLMCNVAIMDAPHAPKEKSILPYAHEYPKARKKEIEYWRKFLLGGQLEEEYMVGEPKFKSVRIYGGIHALRGISRWRLPGQEMWGTIVAGSYIMMDKERGTQLHWRYPESQASYWEKDMDYMIHTFRWK